MLSKLRAVVPSSAKICAHVCGINGASKLVAMVIVSVKLYNTCLSLGRVASSLASTQGATPHHGRYGSRAHTERIPLHTPHRQLCLRPGAQLHLLRERERQGLDPREPRQLDALLDRGRLCPVPGSLLHAHLYRTLGSISS